MTNKSLKKFFYAIDGIGHLNACVGLAQALAFRGHHIYFLINSIFAGQFTKYGLTEIHLQLPIPEKIEKSNNNKNVVKEIAQMLISSGFMCSKTPLEKLKSQTSEQRSQFMEAIFPTFVAFDPQIERAIKQEAPDLIILDSMLIPPAVQRAPCPWIQLISAHPLSVINSGKLPPFGAGYPTESDPSTWLEFKLEIAKHFHEEIGKYQPKLDAQLNYTPIEPIRTKLGSAYPVSPYLNIYGYPQELDYHDLLDEIPDNFVRVDAFMRELPNQESFELPEKFISKNEKLIYFSLGSLGSTDVDLMKRILDVLGKTDHKYIVSKGQRGDEYELPDNCWGEAFLPQTLILPFVDLVITHGGNNTITETFSQGKPMIVMPRFGDQYDNAQRVHEKEYGIRVEPYSFTEPELLNAISQLLNDTELHQRLQVAKERIRKGDSKQRACERIEELAEKVNAEKHLV